MGGFLGIGGSSAKTDRGQTLGGYQDLNNAFGFAFPTSQANLQTGANTTSQGLSGLTGAQSYFQKLASGNRPALLEAAAPAVNSANAQADAAKRQQSSMGTARGGGTAAVNQQADTAKAATIDNLLFGAQSEGAQGEASTGSAIAQTGLGQSGQALQLFGQGVGAAQDVTGDSINSRPTSQAINRQTQQDVTGAITSALNMFA